MFPETTTNLYFGDVTIDEYFEMTRYKFPFLHSMLDPKRFSSRNIEDVFSFMQIVDFEGDTKGGRGRDYFLAQNEFPLNRAVGFRSIFEEINRGGNEIKDVLDVLGGNGTLYRAAELLGYDNLRMVINDISEEMVENAFLQNIPCIRQPAQNLLFKDNVLDAAIYAYGTHHIPMDDRIRAFKETKRVLKEGGVIVFHDYEEGSITSKWYSEILHKYTYTGHDFTHFYKDQLRNDLEEAGFVDVEVFYKYDPFILYSNTAEGAKRELLNHLVSLFGLKKFREKYDYNEEVFYQEAEKIVRKCSDFTNCTDEEINNILKFKELTIRQRAGGFYAEMPRISLMARGVATRD